MRRWRAVWPLVLVVAGCAAYSSRMAPAIRALRQGEAGRAVELVDREPDPGSVLWQIERGLLLRAADRFSESNEAFTAAIQQNDELYTRSVSNEAAALVVSDAVRPYRSPDYELPFVHVYAAFNYLDLGDRDGALVEARALTGLLQERVRPGDEGGPGDWGFGRLLAGLILESGGEWNDAWIAYRAAAAAYEVRGESPEPGLRMLLDDAVKRTAVRAGIEVGEIGSARSRIVVVVEEGLVTPMEDFHLRVPILREEEDWGEDRLGPWSESVGRRACDLRRHRGDYRPRDIAYLVDLAVPVYPERPVRFPAPARVTVAGGSPTVVVPVEDVDEAARADLERRFPVIAARAAARAILKALASRAVTRHSGEMAGQLANMLGVATERADTRSWTTLPARIGLAVIEVPPGPVEVEADSPTHDRSKTATVVVPEGGLAFLDFRLLP
jgi:uncharacterized protein